MMSLQGLTPHPFLNQGRTKMTSVGEASVGLQGIDKKGELLNHQELSWNNS